MGGLGMGSWHGGLAGGEAPTVLEASMELFRRCVEPGSMWNLSGGSRRTALIPPTARSYSGGPALPPPLAPPSSQLRPSRIHTHSSPAAAITRRSPSPMHHRHRDDGPCWRVVNRRAGPSVGAARATAPPGVPRAVEVREDWHHRTASRRSESRERAVSGTAHADVSEVTRAEEAAWASAWTKAGVGIGLGAGARGADQVWAREPAGYHGERDRPGVRSGSGSGLGSSGSSGDGGPGGSPALVPGSGGGGRTNADALPKGTSLDKAEGGVGTGACLMASGLVGWAGMVDDIGSGKVESVEAGPRGREMKNAARAREVRVNGGDGAGDGEASWTAAAAAQGHGRVDGEASLGGDVGDARLGELGLKQGSACVDDRSVVDGVNDKATAARTGANAERVLDVGLKLDFGFDVGVAGGNGGRAGPVRCAWDDGDGHCRGRLNGIAGEGTW